MIAYLLLYSICATTSKADPAIPISKYRPVAKSQPPNVKCYDMYTKKGTPPDKVNDPGVYIFFDKKTLYPDVLPMYVGQSSYSIWAEMDLHYRQGYNSMDQYSLVCYIVTPGNYPPSDPVHPWNYSPYILESLMLAMFCFDSNSVKNGGNGRVFLPKPKQNIPTEIINYKCDAGDADVLERLSFYAERINYIAGLLMSAKADNNNTMFDIARIVQ